MWFIAGLGLVLGYACVSTIRVPVGVLDEYVGVYKFPSGVGRWLPDATLSDPSATPLKASRSHASD